MRLSLILAALSLALRLPLQGAAAASAAPGDSLIARIHFVGARQIAADPNATRLRDLGDLPETAILREATLQKLALAPFVFLQGRAADQHDHADLLRPLAGDLLDAEWYLEAQDSTNVVPEMMLGVHLTGNRPGLWQTNLAQVISAWTGIAVRPIEAEGFHGWELKKHHNPNVIRCFHAQDWVVFGWGQDDLRLQSRWLKRIKEDNRPVDAAKNYWLDARADWPALAAHHLEPESLRLPAMHLTVEGRKGTDGQEYVRPYLVMHFAEPFTLNLPPWRIPTNLIHSPLISFTAVRGILPWFNHLPQVKSLNAAPLPDQMFTWAMDQIPFQTGFAAPVVNATNYLRQFAPTLAALINAHVSGRVVTPQAVWTNDRISFSGIPFLTPNLRAIGTPRDGYLIGWLMPEGVHTNPLPRGLVEQGMAHANLVYYDWEVTGQGLKRWRSYLSLLPLVSKVPVASADSPAQKWLEAAWSKLENCGTEVTAVGSQELVLVRNSQVGFTAIELTLLAAWLDAPGFPFNAHHDDTPAARPVRGGPGGSP